jgi:hypothetical protein
VKSIRLTNHAQEQAIERGTNQAEIVDTIITGDRQPAKNGRYKYQATFSIIMIGRINSTLSRK